MDDKVHEQRNGARIVVPKLEEAPVEEGGGAWVPPAPAAREPRVVVVDPNQRGWAPAFGLAIAAAAAGSLFTNFVEILTSIQFRFLLIGCGTLIGFAVRAGKPPGNPDLHRVLAIVVTYLCMATTYPYWIYQELAHPELFWEEDGGAGAFEGIWDDGGWEEPVGWQEPGSASTEPIRLDSLDAPAAVPTVGLNWGALVGALGWSLAFPFYLLKWLNVWGLIWSVAALGSAYKFSAEGKA